MEKEKPKGRFHDAKIIFFVSSSLLMFGSTYSHLVSFFREENAAKGNSALEYGLVLATYPIAQLITGPMASKITTKGWVTDKQLLIIALITDAVFCMLPALVEVLSFPPKVFLALFVIIRILQSVGGTTGTVLVYVINGVELPNLTHIMIPILETVYGGAMVVGPAVAAVLWDHLGFTAPFITLGIVEILLAILAVFIMPASTCGRGGDHGTAKFRKAAKPSIIVNILSTINAFALISYNEATLSYQLKPFNLSGSVVGLIFFFPAGVYAVSSLFFGFYSKNLSDARYIIIAGFVVSLASLFILGPVMTLWPKLWILLLGQALFGLGLGPAFVCAYLHSVKVIDGGKETKEAHAVLTGLMEPSVAMGNLIGPLTAGFMLQECSYAAGVTINIFQLMVLMAAQIIVVCVERCRTVEPCKPV